MASLNSIISIDGEIIRITFPDLLRFHWRIRDELSVLKETGKRGGSKRVHDQARLMDMKILEDLDWVLSNFRIDVYGNSDT